MNGVCLTGLGYSSVGGVVGFELCSRDLLSFVRWVTTQFGPMRGSSLLHLI